MWASKGAKTGVASFAPMSMPYWMYQSGLTWPPSPGPPHPCVKPSGSTGADMSMSNASTHDLLVGDRLREGTGGAGRSPSGQPLSVVSIDEGSDRFRQFFGVVVVAVA